MTNLSPLDSRRASQSYCHPPHTEGGLTASTAPVRYGIAVPLVLAILTIALAITYALSRTSQTTYKLATRQTAIARAQATAEAAAAIALDNLEVNPNWMPPSSPMTGELRSGERYQVEVQVTDGGRGRRISASAEVLEKPNKQRLAAQTLTIDLAKQRLNNFPVAAIAAFGGSDSDQESPAVFVAAGNEILGDIRSKGPIVFSGDFLPDGSAYQMGDVIRDGTGPEGYRNYRARWSTVYAAEPLEPHGSHRKGRLVLHKRVLGPSATNPLGVFYHEGDVTLHNHVTISGTLVVGGDLEIKGKEIHVSSLQDAFDPSTGTWFETRLPAIVLDGDMVFASQTRDVYISGLILASQDVHRESKPNQAKQGIKKYEEEKHYQYTKIHKKSYKDVSDGRVEASQDKVGGGKKPYKYHKDREEGKSPRKTYSKYKSYDDKGKDKEGKSKGHKFGKYSKDDKYREGDKRRFDQLGDRSERKGYPRIYESDKDDEDGDKGGADPPDGRSSDPKSSAIIIKGAIMADRIILENVPDRPLILVFDPTKTDVTDAPGFFTWRVTEWRMSPGL